MCHTQGSNNNPPLPPTSWEVSEGDDDERVSAGAATVEGADSDDGVMILSIYLLKHGRLLLFILMGAFTHTRGKMRIPCWLFVCVWGCVLLCCSLNRNCPPPQHSYWKFLAELLFLYFCCCHCLTHTHRGGVPLSSFSSVVSKSYERSQVSSLSCRLTCKPNKRVCCRWGGGVAHKNRNLTPHDSLTTQCCVCVCVKIIR